MFAIDGETVTGLKHLSGIVGMFARRVHRALRSARRKERATTTREDHTMQLKKTGLWSVTAALALLTIAGCGTIQAFGSKAVGPVLATVNRQAITGPQWQQSMDAIALLSGQAIPSVSAATKKKQVQELMQWSAIEQWALSHHLITNAKANSAAKAAVSSIEQQAGSAATLKSQLKSYHLTLAEFSNFMVSQEKLQAAYTYATKGVKPPTAAAEKTFYKANGSFFAVPATDEVRAILVKSKSTAQSLESEITSGTAKFAVLAKKYSLDKTSASSGGELGSLTLSSSTNGLPTSFTAEMKTLKAGQYGIADTSKGYYLMEVQKVNPASEQSFASVKSEIAAQLQTTNDGTVFNAFGKKILAKAKTHLYLK